MTNQANPPPHQQIPKQFQKDPEVLRFFEQQQFLIYQLWRKLGGSEDLISEIVEVQQLTSENTFPTTVQELFKRTEGLPEFTIDTTGFTFDNTKITFDKVEA